ncbi:MAG: non-homologous end-joining DNA ligase [Parvibaculaceae bacterium]
MSEAGEIRITHPDRVLFAAMKLTKADIADYYRAAASLMMPYLAERPVSLVRCPQGGLQKCFYQKHASNGFPKLLRKVKIKESDGDVAEYLFIDKPEGLVAGVQFGVLEFHVWGATVDDLERPERMVFDLDPDPAVSFAEVRKAAVELRDFLSEIGLVTFPMLTGGKGVHVIAPLKRQAKWPEVKAFARQLAETMAEHAPGRYVANMSKAKRKGRIFIDYLRNERGATAITPYSTRARDGAPVAWPLDWDGLKRVKGASDFDVPKALRAIRRGRKDPWPDYEKARRPLPV